jgi:hypothetical protein
MCDFSYKTNLTFRYENVKMKIVLLWRTIRAVDFVKKTFEIYINGGKLLYFLKY